MTSASWMERDPDTLEPVVLVAGGLMTMPGWYLPMGTAIRTRGACEVLIAPVYVQDWILATTRGLGPVVTRVGRALLTASQRSAELEASGGAPVILVGHSAGGIVGRILTSPVPFEGRQLNGSGRIGALVTLGSPHQVDETGLWGSPLGEAGVRFANEHVPGAFFAPATGYLSVASRAIVGSPEFVLTPDVQQARARLAHGMYAALLPTPDEPFAEGDGVVPVASALLPGARHVVLPDALHGTGVRTPWYGDEARVEAWWPAAVETWREALRARQVMRTAEG